MATVDKGQSWLEEFERSQIVRTTLRASLTAGVLVSIYYLAPIPIARARSRCFTWPRHLRSSWWSSLSKSDRSHGVISRCSGRLSQWRLSSHCSS